MAALAPSGLGDPKGTTKLGGNRSFWENVCVLNGEGEVAMIGAFLPDSSCGEMRPVPHLGPRSSPSSASGYLGFGAFSAP